MSYTSNFYVRIKNRSFFVLNAGQNATRALMLSLLLALPLAHALAQPAMVRVPARVVEVTVYSDRALVTRQAEVSIGAGETTLVFTDLPAGTDPASLLVSGKGAFTLRDVRLVERQRSRDVSTELKALEDERRVYEDALSAENDSMREAEAERLFLAEMVKRLTSSSGSSETLPLDTAAWAKMLDFHRERNETVNGALRNSRRLIQGIQTEIERINREIRSLGTGSRLSVIEAEIVIEAKGAIKALLDVSYIVKGPSWRPDYVLRADSEASELSMHYRALVRQNTGEDWKDAQLRLSTARPQVGGSMPTLLPWRIDINKPEPVYRSSAKQARVLESSPSPAYMSEEAMADEIASVPDMEYSESRAEAGATAVLFSIPGLTTVDSDNRDRTVTIAMLNMPVVYSYAALPKLSPYAYFKATATNTSSFPLLPGPSHVYVDGGYVSDASLGSVPTGGEFKADLGIDESLTVERKLQRKFDETTGFMSKKTKTTWEYLISIKNGKRKEVTILVYDQLPISSNEQIVVRPKEPEYSKDSPGLKKTEGETLVWTLHLSPGQEASLPLSFSVEYPLGSPVTGLE